MGTCRLCGTRSRFISQQLGVCLKCLRERSQEALHIALSVHRRIRSGIGLPPDTPSNGGMKCPVCGRGCVLGNGAVGYCGFRGVKGGRFAVSTGDPALAPGVYYYDPHPTNCVAYPVCPAVTGMGYPRYSLSPRGERGYYNIAVFYGGCNLDCLYCQNWEHKLLALSRERVISVDDLVKSVNERTTCVCFFGGDPGPFATHALMAAEAMRRKALEIGLKVFRVCWETNGLWSPTLFRRAAELSLESGGVIKVDFKAWSPAVYSALTGIEGKHVELIKKNIELAASMARKRPELPLLVVSTLLVPGYIDEEEVRGIACFLSRYDPNIPYVLLAYHPDYVLNDLPLTPRTLANKAVEAAKRCGLKRVFIGNEWLLS